MTRLKVYMAHSIHERERGKNVQFILEGAGFEVINPFDHQPRHSFLTALDAGKVNPFNWTQPVEDHEQIVNTDLGLIASSDMVLCIYPDNKTIGTPCEMFFAWTLHKIVVSVVPVGLEHHPWILNCSKHVVLTDDDGILKLLEIQQDYEPME
jgi:nucleoside 2-deoxyribosyltransferase